jgi:beta-ureidopropionase / N-carbamoyl-L-amino-acid hydrolase
MNRRDFLQQSAAFTAAPSLLALARSAPPLRINGSRLNGWLTAFDMIGRTAGGINRVAYSEADLAGRAFTLNLFSEAGLPIRVDAGGNMIARVPGTSATLKPIVIGSHIDSVTDGGNFDGPVGSFAAIEVARTLQEQRIRLRHPLEVVVWQNEEGGTIGSKIAVGELTETDLDKVARSGVTIRDGIAKIGGNVAQLATAARARGDVACYIELHIEQGGLLEKAGLQIGVVEGIVGLRWTEVTITGLANHAGATPMDQRQDALLAAARFTVAINETIRAESGRQVATVGRLVATPNTTNVIPGQVVMTIDLRDLNPATLTRFTLKFEQLARDIGAASNTTFTFRSLTNSAPALSDPRVMAWVDSSTTTLGLSRQAMPSGAGHDAQEMAHIAPMGMIFIPSVGGISHSPKEFSHAADITNGANVLLNAVLAADRA